MRLAVVNARIRTGDPRRPWADALVVDGDSVVFVGSSAEARKLAGADTRVIDAQGTALVAPAGMPGQRGIGASFDVVDTGGAVVLAVRNGAVTVDRSARAVHRDDA
jgi:hypothetical protein